MGSLMLFAPRKICVFGKACLASKKEDRPENGGLGGATLERLSATPGLQGFGETCARVPCPCPHNDEKEADALVFQHRRPLLSPRYPYTTGTTLWYHLVIICEAW